MGKEGVDVTLLLGAGWLITPGKAFDTLNQYQDVLHWEMRICVFSSLNKKSWFVPSPRLPVGAGIHTSYSALNQKSSLYLKQQV
jgi:hypothetical protein